MTTQVSRYQKKQSPTHTYPDHQPLSTMIHSILPVQLTCLTVLLHKLSQSPPWSTSWSGTFHFILHTFLHISSCNTCPYHCNQFCCSTKIMSSNPSLCQIFTWNSIFYFNVTHPSEHSHVCPLKCYILFFSYRPGLSSQWLYHLLLIVNDISIFVSNGIN